MYVLSEYLPRNGPDHLSRNYVIVNRPAQDHIHLGLPLQLISWLVATAVRE